MAVLCVRRAETDEVLAKIWGCSSAGRAPALQAGGQEFDPPHLHQSLKDKWYIQYVVPWKLNNVITNDDREELEESSDDKSETNPGNRKIIENVEKEGFSE